MLEDDFSQKPEDMPVEPAQSNNWYILPEGPENAEEIEGDWLELQNNHKAQNGFKIMVWKLAIVRTNLETRFLKLKVSPNLKPNDEIRKKYEESLIRQANLGFYGAFVAGVTGIAINCVAFAMICTGSTDIGMPMMGGGFGLGACATYMYKISEGASNRLDEYFRKNREDKTEKGE